MLYLGIATGLLTWGHIVFGITTDELEGKLYWLSALLLCCWAILLAVQEVAVTVLWIKLRRAQAQCTLERPETDESSTPEESPSEDPHLIF